MKALASLSKTPSSEIDQRPAGRKSEGRAKSQRRKSEGRTKAWVTTDDDGRSLLITRLGVQLWPPSRTFRKPFERDGSAASRQNNCCHEVEKCATTGRKQLLPRVVAKTASGRKQKMPP